jgi:hypothetical protein
MSEGYMIDKMGATQNKQQYTIIIIIINWASGIGWRHGVACEKNGGGGGSGGVGGS